MRLKVAKMRAGARELVKVRLSRYKHETHTGEACITPSIASSEARTQRLLVYVTNALAALVVQSCAAAEGAAADGDVGGKADV